MATQRIVRTVRAVTANASLEYAKGKVTVVVGTQTADITVWMPLLSAGVQIDLIRIGADGFDTNLKYAVQDGEADIAKIGTQWEALRLLVRGGTTWEGFASNIMPA